MLVANLVTASLLALAAATPVADPGAETEMKRAVAIPAIKPGSCAIWGLVKPCGKGCIWKWQVCCDGKVACPGRHKCHGPPSLIAGCCPPNAFC